MQIHRSPGMTGLQASALGVLPPLAAGLAVMRLCEAPIAFLSMQMIGAMLGFVAIGMFGGKLADAVRAQPVQVAALCWIAIAATLVMPGLDGVHRWVTVGGLRLNTGMLFDPVALATVASLWSRERTAAAVGIVAGVMALHVAQPDAGQATALACGALALAALPGARPAARLALSGVAVVGMVAAWARPDALMPTDLVENIVPMAFDVSLWLGLVAVASLAALPVAAVRFTLAPRPVDGLQRAMGVALTAYLVGSVIVVALGAFPTPVLGFGASPLLGTILGLGLLGELANGRGVDEDGGQGT